MLTRTSISAIRTLVYLGLREGAEPVPPRRIASDLKESPSYLAKVTGQLVKAGLLRAHRGVLGGVTLARNPGAVTLLSVVEACQGHIAGSFCSHDFSPSQTCAFHQAGLELFNATIEILSKWTLANLVHRPVAPARVSTVPCWIQAGAITPAVFSGVADKSTHRRQGIQYTSGRKTSARHSVRKLNKR